MKKYILFIIAIFATVSIYAQHEKVELNEFCYFEDADNQVNEYSIKPYTYHNRLELKFQSGYQITIKMEDKDKFASIINKFEEFDKSSKEANKNAPQLIDNFSPETISFTKKVIDTNQNVKIYYCKELKETKSGNGNLIIKIPELTDMFGGSTAPETYFYLTSECVNKLKNALE